MKTKFNPKVQKVSKTKGFAVRYNLASEIIIMAPSLEALEQFCLERGYDFRQPMATPATLKCRQKSSVGV